MAVTSTLQLSALLTQSPTNCTLGALVLTSPQNWLLTFEAANSETVERLELSARLSQEEGRPFESDNKNRSKSLHYFPEHIVIPSHKTRMLAAEGVRSNIEKGNKRKALAKRLESLRIPSNIESSDIASLREWLPPDGIYSLGSYVTPKFGSYSVRSIRNSNESNEDSTFSPELESAFEQCMQNLDSIVDKHELNK